MLPFWLISLNSSPPSPRGFPRFFGIFPLFVAVGEVGEIGVVLSDKCSSGKGEVFCFFSIGIFLGGLIGLDSLKFNLSGLCLRLFLVWSWLVLNCIKGVEIRCFLIGEAENKKNSNLEGGLKD